MAGGVGYLFQLLVHIDTNVNSNITALSVRRSWLSVGSIDRLLVGTIKTQSHWLTLNTNGDRFLLLNFKFQNTNFFENRPPAENNGACKRKK